ncbi:MAG: hypothetical protein AB2A00_08680 [Myxococcota bacterium]
MRQLLLITAVLSVLCGGCMFLPRPPIQQGLRITNDRFEVIRLNKSQLSPDQRKVLADSGTPSHIVFESELKTGKPVQRWVYTKDNVIYVFLDGKKVDYVEVESTGSASLLDPSQAEEGPLLVAWKWIQLLGHWLRRY